MTSFRFIHTADIHLDSPLKGLAGYDGPAVECIRTATRQAFDNLMSEAIDQKVDFVVIAGDLYDGDWRDYQTGLFFARQMGRLAKASKLDEPATGRRLRHRYLSEPFQGAIHLDAVIDDVGPRNNDIFLRAHPGIRREVKHGAIAPPGARQFRILVVGQPIRGVQ